MICNNLKEWTTLVKEKFQKLRLKLKYIFEGWQELIEFLLFTVLGIVVIDYILKFLGA